MHIQRSSHRDSADVSGYGIVHEAREGLEFRVERVDFYVMLVAPTVSSWTQQI